MKPASRPTSRAPRTLLRWALCAICAVSGTAAFAQEGERPAADGPRAQESSLFGFVETVAATLEERARAESIAGPVQVQVNAGRSVDPRTVDRVFTSRLRRRLRDRGVLTPSAKADVRVRMALSMERGRLWAVGTLEGGALPGPSALAVSRPIDRELEALFGRVSGVGRSRWVLERLGPLPPGVLDIMVQDVDGDLVDEVVVLGVDAIRTYRFTHGESRLEEMEKAHPLPGRGRWPRVVLGWLAPAEKDRIWFATSQGQAWILDVATGKFSPPPVRGVPLRQTYRHDTPTDERVLLLGGEVGSPTLNGPVRFGDGGQTKLGEGPRFMRDVARWRGARETWLWVDETGRIGGRVGDKPTVTFPGMDAAGDRLVVFDLDGDGALELATSAATSPGEADRLTLYRVTGDLQRLAVAFRSPLSGGSLVAMAVGDLDFDSRPELLVVEELEDDETTLWRLEYAP